VKNYGPARQTTDGNKIMCMDSACWIIKATDTHSEYAISIAFYGTNGFANAPQYYVYNYIARVLSESAWK
jgi:hypothetical protein